MGEQMGGISFYGTVLSCSLMHSGFSPCISYLLVCNKLPQHSTAEKYRYVLSHSASETQESKHRLAGMFWLKVSHEL